MVLFCFSCIRPPNSFFCQLFPPPKKSGMKWVVKRNGFHLHSGVKRSCWCCWTWLMAGPPLPVQAPWCWGLICLTSGRYLPPLVGCDCRGWWKLSIYQFKSLLNYCFFDFVFFRNKFNFDRSLQIWWGKGYSAEQCWYFWEQSYRICSILCNGHRKLLPRVLLLSHDHFFQIQW